MHARDTVPHLVAALLVAALGARAAPGAHRGGEALDSGTLAGRGVAPNLASVLGATHWSPCYFLNASLPSLWDGAAALATTGTTAIKFVLDADCDSTYPWNTDCAAVLEGVHTLADLAAKPLFDAVLRGSTDPSWNFTVFDIIAYRISSAAVGWNYWCTSFTPDDGANETAEFAGLTAHLLTALEGSGKRVLLEHCGNYDPSKAPDPAVQARMVQWLAARQAGVDAGRAAWCAAARARPGAPPVVAALNCADGRGVHAAAGVEVLHATEVNLVWTSMQAGFPNNVLQVLPHVALDAVSYSSYDSMHFNPGFGAALDFIAAHHNRTTASPPAPAVWIAEYGVAQNEESAAYVRDVYGNVNAWALSAGPAGRPRSMHTFAWELFDNEVTVNARFPGGRCNAGTGPEFNASNLHGFWLIRPDGSKSPSFDAVVGVINGSAPAPTPAPPAPCTFTPDTDVQGTGGYEVDAGTPDACCAACNADLQCASAVHAGGQCWVKYAGGAPVPKAGVTRCAPVGRVGAAQGGAPTRPRTVPAGAAASVTALSV